MKKICEWLDGKKTIIGGALIIGSYVLPKPYDEIAYTLGGLIGGTGLVHKYQKNKTKKAK